VWRTACSLLHREKNCSERHESTCSNAPTNGTVRSRPPAIRFTFTSTSMLFFSISTLLHYGIIYCIGIIIYCNTKSWIFLLILAKKAPAAAKCLNERISFMPVLNIIYIEIHPEVSAFRTTPCTRYSSAAPVSLKYNKSSIIECLFI